MSFAENLKKIRESNHMSQVELAQLIKVSKTSVSNWERGIAPPKSQYVTAISKLYQVSIDELMNEREQFVSTAFGKYGCTGKEQAERLVEESRSLFFGGEMSQEDIDVVFQALTEMYWDAKKREKEKF